jgi:hypothetical protein
MDLVPHNEYIKQIKYSFSKIEKKKVTDGFLASLSSRKLEYRGYLGCWAVARVLPIHDLIPTKCPSGNIACRYCLYCDTFERDIEYLNYIDNMLMKFGGVRCDDTFIIGYCLEKFIEIEVPEPQQADFDIFNNLIETIIKLDTKEKPRDLEKKMSKILKSNKWERELILDQLGVIGLLETKEHKGYFETYNLHQEPHPSWNDWVLPIVWWRGKDGINWEVYDYYFGDYPELKRF